MLLEPKPITLKTQEGVEKTFLLSKFPAVAGREIVVNYPLSNMPKLGDYKVSEEIMLKLMAYVGIEVAAGNIVTLGSRELVNNHASDWEMLARLEYAMMEYNCSFFGTGLNSASFESISRKAVQWITKTLMDLSAQSSPPGKPPSVN